MNVTYTYYPGLPEWKTHLTNLQKNVLTCYLQDTCIKQHRKVEKKKKKKTKTRIVKEVLSKYN